MTQKVHHQTERGARIALAKKQISQESYDAVLAGTLTLPESWGAAGARTIPARAGAVTRRAGRPRGRAARSAHRVARSHVSAGVVSPCAGRIPDSVPGTTLGFTASSNATWRRTRCCGTSGSPMNKKRMPRKGD